jgi:uncharacterized membrane protein HdeD (DUF308 family)
VNISTVVELARWWWAFCLRGVIAIVFGILAFAAPGIGGLILVYLFGAWALIEGVTSLATGIRRRKADRNWWIEVLEGVLSILAGLIAFVLPEFAAEILVLLIAVWAIVVGVFQVFLAIRLRDEMRGEFWLGLAGVAAVLLGIGMLLFPAAAALSLVWLIGTMAIVFGVFLVIVGWRLRRINELAKRDAATDYGGSAPQ